MQQAPVQPLLLDPEDLVTNPAPDEARGTATPRDIRREKDDITTIDPPRPTS